jgi:hypothetical protein
MRARAHAHHTSENGKGVTPVTHQLSEHVKQEGDMSDKLEAGLKICADTKRHLADWERRKEAAGARSQTAEGRAFRKAVANYNAALDEIKRKRDVD